MVTIECAWCGKPATVPKLGGKRATQPRYCSRTCKRAFDASPQGRARYADRPYRSHEYQQRWWAAHPRRKPPTPVDWSKSRQLRLPMPRKPPILRGPANWRWKGGITDENTKWRQSDEYKRWRLAVFRRDRFVCQRCGAKASGRGSLVAHHLKSWHEYPALRFDVDNGQTLCRPCHAIVDPYVHGNDRGWGRTR